MRFLQLLQVEALDGSRFSDPSFPELVRKMADRFEFRKARGG